MKRATQKLHSRRGASILLALLMILVATMVSTVIVSAAVTTAKRVHDDESREQDYLTVNSAARLITAYLLENTKYTFHTLSYEHSEDNPNRRVHTDENADSAVVQHLSEMVEALEADAEAVNGTITVSAPSGDDEELPMTAVTMEYSLKPISDESHEFNDHEKTFTFSGEIFMGDNKAESPQRLFFSGMLAFTYASDNHLASDELREYISGYETNDDGEEGEPIYSNDPGTRHIYKWELNPDIRLSTSEGAS